MRTEARVLPPPVPSLLRIRWLFNTADPARAADAIQRVVDCGSPAELLLRMLATDRDVRVALHATQALALLGDNNALRFAAVHFLDYPGTGEWVARQGWRGAFALMTQLGYRDDWKREAVLAALAPYVPEHEARLLRLVDADLGDASLQAVRLLGRHGSERALQALLTLRADRSMNVDLRECAAAALGEGAHLRVIEARVA